jgi:hypothetical protein
MAEGDKLGVDATPTLFVNGERIAGAASEDELRSVIDRALKDAGETPPPAPKAAAATSLTAPSEQQTPHRERPHS